MFLTKQGIGFRASITCELLRGLQGSGCRTIQQFFIFLARDVHLCKTHLGEKALFGAPILFFEH